MSRNTGDTGKRYVYVIYGGDSVYGVLYEEEEKEIAVSIKECLEVYDECYIRKQETYTEEELDEIALELAEEP